MPVKDTLITRKKLNLIAKNRGIKDPHKMSIGDLINTLSRQDSKRETYSICRKFRKLNLNKFIKKQNISKNDLHKAKELHNMSIDNLKKIAILRRIKNYDNLSREDLIYTILRSESSLIENNYMKYINNNTNDKIKPKINNIRIILSRLGNIVTKDDTNKIREELYEIERIYNRLIELANILDKKENYKYNDYDDLDYFGIKDLEILLNNSNDDDHYKLALVKSSFKNNYEYYEIRGNKDKKLSIKQYLYMIIPYLVELINKKKNNSSEYKIQLSMGINFMSINDKERTRTFHVKSDSKEIILDNDTNDIINELIESFFHKYQKEENILRNGSNYIFESVDILSINFHKIDLKRGKSYIKSPQWILNKRATINPKNTKDNKCFQYSIIAALNHKEIGKDPQRI